MELITALDIDGIIGLDNNLPWHVPEDLAFFKNMTQGHVVLSQCLAQSKATMWVNAQIKPLIF